MKNTISQIENAPTMQDVSKIIEELYHYAYQQGQISMAKEVVGTREGLQPKVQLSDVHHSNLKIPETEAHTKGYHSPKAVKWSPELDRLIVGAATRGLDLEKLARVSKNGATVSALKSRLYKLNYHQPRGSKVWVKKEVA